MRKIISIFSFLLLLTANVHAIEKISSAKHELLIQKAWVRPASKTRNTALYMQIVNNGKQADTLIGLESKLADRTEIHKSVIENDIAQMVEISKLAIPEQNTVSFRPGGIHVMLFGLNDNLKIGEKVKIQLKFEHAGKIEVEAIVAQKEQ